MRELGNRRTGPPSSDSHIVIPQYDYLPPTTHTRTTFRTPPHAPPLPSSFPLTAKETFFAKKDAESEMFDNVEEERKAAEKAEREAAKAAKDAEEEEEEEEEHDEL